ncbi:hypothetical protein [Dinoroseobacter sp. S375]|uniref:hypothetical protein n=1 Tax=Dinoroseobacter sp. S375 TaxID=3415136 RepID=UPI003C7C531A
MTDPNPGPPVRRRKVFYLPGYDPFPPRRYRELYRREGAAQARISGYELSLQGQPGGTGWTVQFAEGGAEVHSTVTVLVWSDLVQASMQGGVTASYLALLRTAWIYLGSGALWRLARLRKGPVIAALYPVVALLGQLAVALGLGFALWGAIGGVFGGLSGLVLGLAVLQGGYRADRWLYAHYLMRDYAYSARDGGAYPAPLAARLTEFAETIAAAAEEGADEVLVVGHSSGAYLAISVLAELNRQNRVAVTVPLGLLTLGQVVPMVSALPRANQLRADLAEMGAQDRIFWLDVTAPGDGCAFALCDPVAVSGVAGADQRAPVVISARFTQTLAPETWARLRWRFFQLHFQYLCAFDRPGDYDYFRITAGPLSLRDRFADRASSPSVLRRNVAPRP